MAGRKVIAFSEEESMTELTSRYPNYKDVVRVIFTNTYSYHLKFLKEGQILTKQEHQDHLGYKIMEFQFLL
jgi:hypothetical protein